jgi:hypothetical protein
MVTAGMHGMNDLIWMCIESCSFVHFGVNETFVDVIIESF